MAIVCVFISCRVYMRFCPQAVFLPACSVWGFLDGVIMICGYSISRLKFCKPPAQKVYVDEVKTLLAVLYPWTIPRTHVGALRLGRWRAGLADMG